MFTLPHSERNTLTDTSPNTITTQSSYLLAQVRESFGRVAYTHKTHEKQADNYQRRHTRQQVYLVIFTALGTASFLSVILNLLIPKEAAAIITSTIAFISTWLSLAANKLKYSEKAKAHRDSAAEIWNVRESYISLITDLMSGKISELEAQERRDELQATTHSIYAQAPRTQTKSYKQAQKALQHNEELTFSPEEIDLLLPQALRIKEQSN